MAFLDHQLYRRPGLSSLGIEFGGFINFELLSSLVLAQLEQELGVLACKFVAYF